MKHSFDLFVFLNRSKYFHYCSINRPESFIRSIQPLNITIYLRKQSLKVIPNSGKGNRTFSPCLVFMEVIATGLLLHGSHCYCFMGKGKLQKLERIKKAGTFCLSLIYRCREKMKSTKSSLYMSFHNIFQVNQ